MAHYDVGEYFDLHHDSSTKFQKRKITFLVYLNNVDEGGDTYFPLANKNTYDNDTVDTTNELIHKALSESTGRKGELDSQGLYVKPMAGRAVLFVNLNENGKPNPKVRYLYTLHTYSLSLSLTHFAYLQCLSLFFYQPLFSFFESF